MLVKQLNAESPCRDETLWRNYQALYEGGKLFHDRVKHFLPRNPQEPHDTWQLRARESVYRSYVGTVIDYFAAQMFAVPVIYKPEDDAEPPDWFQDFENDCDGRGTDLLEFLRQSLVDALTVKVATVELDFPETYGRADSRYDADKTGASDVRLRRVERHCFLDWERDPRGNLVWSISKTTKRPRATPEDKREATLHEWRVLDREQVRIYRALVDDNKILDENSNIEPVVELRHGLDTVPTVELCIDDGLWVANRLESAQIEHYRLSSGLSWSIKRTCYAMPLFKVGDPESFSPGRMGSGYYIAISNNDSAEFLAPPTGHLSLTAEEIKNQKDEIFRLVTQMSLGVDNNAAAVGRSAESKIADAEAIRVVLRAYAAQVRDFLKNVLNLLSKARGDNTEWTVEGLDKFETLAPETLVELLTQAIQLDIPSETFQLEAKYRAAIGVVPGLDEETRGIIRDEIEQGLKEQERADEELREIARGLAGAEAEGSEEGDSGRSPAASAAEEAEQGSPNARSSGNGKGRSAIRGRAQRSA